MIFVGIVIGVVIAWAAVLPLRWVQRRYAAWAREEMPTTF